MNKLEYISESDSIIGWSDSTIAQSESNDCVVRAIAAATGSCYDEAHKYVAEVFNRKPNQGTVLTSRKLKDSVFEYFDVDAFLYLNNDSNTV